MVLKCLGSGSSGNSYLLKSSSGRVLILDAGLPIKDIQRGLDWNIGCVDGCLVTHSHKDHSRSVEDLEFFGIPVISPYREEMKMIKKSGIIGKEWKVYTFDLTTIDGKWTHTNADGTECPCYGFLITHNEMGKLLYITDTEFCKWRFSGVNHILISCNYQKKYVDSDNQAKSRHVYRGHMELETVKCFVEANKTSALENVILCHLSKDNADADECVAEVKKIAPAVNVDVAQAGKEWTLMKGDECPF